MRKFTLRALGLMALFTLTLSNASAQSSSIDIEYNSNAELLINGHLISSKTSIEEAMEIMGEVSRMVESSNAEKSYFYDEIGVVLATKDGVVRGVGINFNWDGDNNFPETSFTGDLILGDTEINKETKSATIAAIRTIEFICPFPLMCASKDRSASVNCTIAFKETKITQVVFTLK